MPNYGWTYLSIGDRSPSNELSDGGTKRVDWNSDAMPPLTGELTDDEDRAKGGRIGTLGWPRYSSFGGAGSALAPALMGNSTMRLFPERSAEESGVSPVL